MIGCDQTIYAHYDIPISTNIYSRNKKTIKMLYLEDYLEMIEHLPIELRDRFTEMREIDLGVENTVDRSVMHSSVGLSIMI